MSNSAEQSLTAIKFSRLAKRGVLLGLSGPQLVMASLAAATLILGLYRGAVVMTFPISLVFVVLGFVAVGGRKLVEWGPIGARWVSRSIGAQLVYRRRVVKPRPAGTLALPGDAARLRQWVDPETGAVMVHDPHAATLTAVIGVSHPAFVLLDPAEQERRVVSWGRVLATACRSGRLASLQVMERTLPDSGKGLADWWEQHGNRTETWPSTTYGELVERAGPAGERHASPISISLDIKVAGRAIRGRRRREPRRGRCSPVKSWQPCSPPSGPQTSPPRIGSRPATSPSSFDLHTTRPSPAHWSGTVPSAVTWRPPGLSPSPSSGAEIAATPRTTAFSGSANGRARWSSRASSHHFSCRPESGGRSRCSIRRCASTGRQLEPLATASVCSIGSACIR